MPRVLFTKREADPIRQKRRAFRASPRGQRGKQNTASVELRGGGKKRGKKEKEAPRRRWGDAEIQDLRNKKKANKNDTTQENPARKREKIGKGEDSGTQRFDWV